MKCTPINKIVLELNEHECRTILSDIEFLQTDFEKHYEKVEYSNELKFLIDYLKKGVTKK
jgi:hypothetical protein